MMIVLTDYGVKGTMSIRHCQGFLVAYPLLRVETEEVEIEGERGLPPDLLGPASIEPLVLEIDCHLSPFETAKAADLAKSAFS